MAIPEDTGYGEVPTWPELIQPVLTVLKQRETLHRKDVFDRAAEVAQLSDNARNERLNSGGLRYEERMSWVLSHLFRAGLVDRPNRGRYAINDAALAWMAEYPNGMNYSTARIYFDKFWPTKPANEPAISPSLEVDEIGPIEMIDQGVEQLLAKVGADLLERLRGTHPDFFEEAVVQLLLKMGYGGAEAHGRRIGGSGDGGVDGVIDQDPLGLDQIYVQAKRYGEKNTVGREAIQAFVGALHGKGASKGIFITTSSFTAHAKEYAAVVPSRPILVDGPRLVKLMIKYRVGVQVKQTYDVVAVDEDFFE